MEYSKILSRFIAKSPFSVLTRMTLENLFGAARLDQIFEDAAEKQYTKSLLFSTCADLLVEVTLFGCTSVRASYLRNREEIPVSLVAVYEKLQGIEPAVCETLVSRTAERAARVVGALQATRPEPVAGYRLRIADGNVLRRSERRLKILQGSNIAALPGRTVALFDHATQLISRLVVCENAHTSEKRLMLELLPHIEPNDLFLADCAFGTMEFFHGLRARQASFLIRHHSSTTLTPVTKRRRVCRSRTGVVFEQQVRSSDGQEFRAIIIRRDKPLRNGKRELILLTNVPRSKASAKKLAHLYLKRWTIEEAFRQLTQYLSCEVSTLGYPKAALLAFSLAVLAYNCLGCVKAAMAGRFGWDKVDAELSSYYLATEVKRTYEGMSIAVPEEEWDRYRELSVESLAAEMRQIATQVDWPRYRKSPRGPKKSYRKTRKKHLHVATAKLLEQATKERVVNNFPIFRVLVTVNDEVRSSMEVSGMDAYLPDVERMMQRLYSSLTEKGRRRYAAVEAAKLGHGGVEYIARILGCDPKTIRRGLQELEGTDNLDGDRDRKKGADASYTMQSIRPWKRIS